MTGPGIVVFGAQWGDEGKGKIVDMLTTRVEAIVRFQGGNNAGHTLVVGGEKTILHLIPSGVLHEGKHCLIGNGVVLDPEVFCAEIDKLAASGVDVSPSRMTVSYKTQLIMPYHRALDQAREAAKAGGKIGTTGRGIGPCYEDKASRVGIRAGDLLNETLLRAKVEYALAEKNALLKGMYGGEGMTADEVLSWLAPFAARLKDYVGDVSAIIQDTAAAGKRILFEGAQGTHLDIDHGTYPFVTSSNTVSGNAAAGSGCAPSLLHRIVAVVKAYTTRVGAGPFPTELDCKTGEHLQSVGCEFGATTGRKRRCGWLDLVILRESVRLNGPTEIALTKLDVLTGLKELKLCVAYRYKGEVVAYPPQLEGSMGDVEPIYEVLPGWDEDITGAKRFESLPQTCRAYIRRIEELVNVPVGIVSVGAGREQTILRPLR